MKLLLGMIKLYDPSFVMVSFVVFLHCDLVMFTLHLVLEGACPDIFIVISIIFISSLTHHENKNVMLLSA